MAGADRAFTVVKGGRDDGPPAAPPPNDGASQTPCPIMALGHLCGRFYFLDRVGQQVELSARALGNRHELLNTLFGGQDQWLRSQFPKKIKRKAKDEQGNDIEEEIVVDFALNQASAYLARACFQSGMWGDHIVLRRPGVWPETATPGAAAFPAVHCGDKVLIGTNWHDAGHRIDNTIWAAAAPVPRPGTPCDHSIGETLQSELQRLFKFRQAGGAIVVVGLLGTAYFGGAAQWRSSGFLLGQSGCGKSTLLQVLRACAPMHWFSNDTSKAGLEQGLNGRAMPCFLDETEKSGGDVRGAQTLLDLVLTASGGGGTQGARGGIDGHARRIEVVSSVIMAATAPPEMRETHLGRFALIELDRPDGGEDFRAAHEALIANMKKLGPALWGRALSSWERYNRALESFRTELSAKGCAPREMDQLGAILAGWWVLVRDGDPQARGALEGVAGLADFTRTTDIVAEDSNARRLVQYLMTKAVQLDRSTAREPIGNLILRVIAGNVIGEDYATGVDTAKRALGAHGIRVIRLEENPDPRIPPEPCLSMGGGIWLNPRATELASLFENSDWAASRWISGLLEMDRCKRSTNAIRVGGVVTKAIWLPLEELQLVDERRPGSDPPREL